MRPGTVVRRNPSIVFQRLAADGGGVLLHLDSDAYHNLNAVGVLVWELIERPTPVSDLAEQFCATFDQDAESAHADLLRFLDELVERNLILAVRAGPDGEQGFTE